MCQTRLSRNLLVRRAPFFVLYISVMTATSCWPEVATVHGETLIPLQNSAYSCHVDDGAAKGTLGKIIASDFVPLPEGEIDRVVTQLSRVVSALERQYRRDDRKRLDSRGSPEAYAAAQQQETRTFVKKRRKENLLNDIQACRAGSFSRIDDISDPLLPSRKVSWDPAVGYQPPADLPDESASEAFSYSRTAYEVTQKTVHGVQVVVAVHKDTIAARNNVFTTAEFAQAVIDQVHAVIDLHGGFPVDRFVFKVCDPRGTGSFALCRGGVTISAHAYMDNDWGLEQTHEILHSWNGKLYTYVPDGTSNLFQTETLVTEEFTVYYQYLIQSQVLRGPYHFSDAMLYWWWYYGQYQGNPEFDLPFPELAAMASGFGTGTSIYRSMMNARGLLVAYAVDRALVRNGKTLDGLMKHLYQNFGLTGKQYTLKEVLNALSSLSGRSFKSVFNRYVFSSGDFTMIYGTNPSFEPLR